MIVNQLESPPLESDKTQNKKSADQAVQADKKRAWQTNMQKRAMRLDDHKREYIIMHNNSPFGTLLVHHWCPLRCGCKNRAHATEKYVRSVVHYALGPLPSPCHERVGSHCQGFEVALLRVELKRIVSWGILYSLREHVGERCPVGATRSVWRTIGIWRVASARVATRVCNDLRP